MYKEIVSFEGSFLTKDGYIELRDVPGIGVEINEEGMRKFATTGIPFFK